MSAICVPPGASMIAGVDQVGISSRRGADVLIDEVRVYNSALSNDDWDSAMQGN